MWLKIDDKLPQSVKVRGLAAPVLERLRALTGRDRTKRDRNSALGAWALIAAWASGERTDGWVPREVVEEYATPHDVARLTRPTFGRAPMLHRAGERCRCLDGRPAPAGAEFAVHDYLERNPSRAENDIARRQRAELRDRELRAAVRRRDGDCCRYCGRGVNWQDRKSAAGGVLEHVIPDRADGAANLVVACRGCNSRKGKRTPEAAGMVLRPIRDGSTTDQPRITGSVLDPTRDGPAERHENALDQLPVPNDAHAGGFGPHVPAQRAETAIHDGHPEPIRDARTDAPGRVRDGHPPVIDRSWPGRDTNRPRTALDGNPYLRSALTGPAPDDHAGLPTAEDMSR